MEAEHYSEQEFVSGNYGTRTCPRTEWEFVTSPKDHVTYPGEHPQKHTHPPTHIHTYTPTPTHPHTHAYSRTHARTHTRTHARTRARAHTHPPTHPPTGEQRGRCLHGRVRKHLHHLMQVNQKFTCFTGTKVQILTLTRLPLPYTAARVCHIENDSRRAHRPQVLAMTHTYADVC